MANIKRTAIVVALLLAGCSSESPTPRDGASASDAAAATPDTGGRTDQGPPPDGVQPADTAPPDSASPSPDTGEQPCGSCHDLPPSGGRHALHVGQGYQCSECHGCVVDAQRNITDPSRHDDGNHDVCGAFTWDSSQRRCSSISCHSAKSW